MNVECVIKCGVVVKVGVGELPLRHQVSLAQKLLQDRPGIPNAGLYLELVQQVPLRVRVQHRLREALVQRQAFVHSLLHAQHVID